MNKVLESAKYIFENSNRVKIDQGAIGRFCDSFDTEHIKHWLKESPFEISSLEKSERLNFLLFFNSISFCYWGEPKWTVEYSGKKYDGAWGMIASFERAVHEDIPVLDSDFWANCKKSELEHILRGNAEIPLLEERWKIIRGVGSILKNRFGGDFEKIISSSKKDAMRLLERLTSDFPTFNDFSAYRGKNVHFHKQAQLLIADVYQTFNGRGIGEFQNIGELTACADYKLPWVMRKLGILSYSNALAGKVDQKVLIPKGSEEEVEIRGNTIWATELIKRRLKGKIAHISASHINDRLWLLGQNKSPGDKPYHRTRTTSY